MKLNTLKPGDLVAVHWPGSSDGKNEKLGMVRVVNKASTKVGINVARTTPKGAYTGDYGKSVRWFDAAEILRRVANG